MWVSFVFEKMTGWLDDPQSWLGAHKILVSIPMILDSIPLSAALVVLGLIIFWIGNKLDD